MNEYQKAAILFGKEGALGESDAIANYLNFMALMKEEPVKTVADIVAMSNVKERIADEINHLLGDILDAIKIADLKIAPDGLDEILEGLRSSVDQEYITELAEPITEEVCDEDATEDKNESENVDDIDEEEDEDADDMDEEKEVVYPTEKPDDHTINL